jgi:hypothetical protein|tara:strand:+ start:6414 stop:6731 length:318 start_codon:yes stop_codon:yes gene_type:complete
MTKSEEDTLRLDSDVPPPEDRRGKGEKLPKGLKDIMQRMEIGQSFRIDSNEIAYKRTIAAIRSAIQRFMSTPASPINDDWVFSVRVQKNSEGVVEGIRVWRLESK